MNSEEKKLSEHKLTILAEIVKVAKLTQHMLQQSRRNVKVA